MGREEESIKLSGTKWYVDIEYKGKIARFGGDLCIDGFAAIASSMSWVRHIGPLEEGEKEELMRAAQKYSQKHKGKGVYFLDDKGVKLSP